MTDAKQIELEAMIVELTKQVAHYRGIARSLDKESVTKDEHIKELKAKNKALKKDAQTEKSATYNRGFRVATLEGDARMLESDARIAKLEEENELLRVSKEGQAKRINEYDERIKEQEEMIQCKKDATEELVRLMIEYRRALISAMQTLDRMEDGHDAAKKIRKALYGTTERN